jgi:hypothetical protein
MGRVESRDGRRASCKGHGRNAIHWSYMLRHDIKTIISMAVIGSAAATRLHEGLGHGVIAWLRGDILPNSPAIICRQ